MPKKNRDAPYDPDPSDPLERPLFVSPVTAGFPSPAEHAIEGKLDLNKHLIQHPAATFFVRVTGESMIDAGIHPGDIAIVDRSLEPVDRKVVIAVLDGELTIKRLRIKDGEWTLLPENKHFEPVRITDEMAFEIWGVVTSVIHLL
ncbi:MAG: translesion error-prone DNA polymerase V autoproteolytic subunit [Candidatus Latescibacterota bacterium]